MGKKNNRRPKPRPSPSGPTGASGKGVLALNDGKAIALIQKAAENAGVKSFVLVFPSSGEANDSVIHINNMPFEGTINGLITALNNAVNVDIANHPEYTEEYKTILAEFMEDIINSVKRSNNKLEAWNAQNK